MKAYERFLKYVQINTASSETSDTTPSTACQFDLANLVAEEMREIGVSEVYVDEHAYVYGVIPASEGLEDAMSIGFIAHLDTIPDFPGENVKPALLKTMTAAK